MLLSSLQYEKQVHFTISVIACGDTWCPGSALCVLVKDLSHVWFFSDYKDNDYQLSCCFRVPSLTEISAKLHIARPQNDSRVPELNIYSSSDCQYEVSNAHLFYSYFALLYNFGIIRSFKTCS